MQTIQVGKGETLRALAQRLYRDERAAALLAMFNPGLPTDEAMADGTAVRVPDRATAQEWASKKGISLGFDPAKGGGTKQRRAWKSFQTGPASRTTNSVEVGPEQAFNSWLGEAGGKAMGPGLVTAEMLGNGRVVYEALSERMQWLGADRVMEAAAEMEVAGLEKRAGEVAAAVKAPDAAQPLVDGACKALMEVLCLEVLKEARRLFARAQQALAATANDPQGGMHLIAALKDADRDSRVRLLTTLAISKATATMAAEAVDRIGAVKSALTQAAVRSGAERNRVLAELRVPKDRQEALLAKLQPPLSPSAAEQLALDALGLEAVANQGKQGASAMLAVVQKATQVMKARVDGPLAMVHLSAARVSVYRARGISLDPAAFPHADGEAATVLDQAVISQAAVVAEKVKPPPDMLKVAWKVVETLGPQLGEVDASALGRGVGCLLARVASSTPAAASPDAVKKLRPGDLLAMSGAAAVRAQSGVDIARSLVPLAAGLAALSRFSFVQTAVNPQTRLELRRRLVDGFRAAYAVPPGLPVAEHSADQVKRALQTFMEQALLLTSVLPDMGMRVQRVRPALESAALVEALVRYAGPARYKFRREEMSADGKWLCTAAWLLDKAKELPAADGAAAAVHMLLNDDGGRLLDLVEKALLAKLG